MDHHSDATGLASRSEDIKDTVALNDEDSHQDRAAYRRMSAGLYAYRKGISIEEKFSFEDQLYLEAGLCTETDLSLEGRLYVEKRRYVEAGPSLADGPYIVPGLSREDKLRIRAGLPPKAGLSVEDRPCIEDELDDQDGLDDQDLLDTQEELPTAAGAFFSDYESRRYYHEPARGLSTDQFFVSDDEHGATCYHDQGATRFDRDEETGDWDMERPIPLIPRDPRLGIFSHAGLLYAHGTFHDADALSPQRLAQLKREAGGHIHDADDWERDVLERVRTAAWLQAALDGLQWLDELRQDVYDSRGRFAGLVAQPLVEMFEKIERQTWVLRGLTAGSDEEFVRPLDYEACAAVICGLRDDVNRLVAMGEVLGWGMEQIACAA